MPSTSATAAPALDPPADRDAIVRIAHRAERGLVARRAERELVQVGLADDDGAGAAQVRDDRRVVIRAGAAARSIPTSSASRRRRPDPSPTPGCRAAARDSGRRRCRPRPARPRRARAPPVTVMKARSASLPRGDAIQARARQLHRRELSPRDRSSAAAAQATRAASSGSSVGIAVWPDGRNSRSASRSACSDRDSVSSSGFELGQSAGFRVGDRARRARPRRRATSERQRAAHADRDHVDAVRRPAS